MKDRTLPPGWPEGVKLPTQDEAEQAVIRIGQMIELAEKRRRDQHVCHCSTLGLRHGPWCPDWEEMPTP